MFLILLIIAQLQGPNEIYTVSDRESFIQAVGSNRTIVVTQGAPIILSYFEDTIQQETEHVTWSLNSDGSSLVIHDVENLVITGEGSRESSLLAEPRYVFVVEFRNCQDIRIENLRMGHTVGGYCDSGVLGVKDCNGFTVKDCLLFGSGTEGLTIHDSQSFFMTSSEVSDCTYGIMTCINSDLLRFEECVFRNNREYYGVDLIRCTGVEFNRCLFRDNYCDFTPAFINSDSQDLVLTECVFDRIESPGLFSRDDFKIKYCDFSDITGVI